MAKPRVNSKHVHSALDASIHTLRLVSPDIDELLRRREHDATDGYPASSRGGNGSGGTISDPTLRAALQEKQQDSTAMAIDGIMARLSEIDQLCKGIQNSHRLVFETESNERGRQSTVKSCAACENPVSGYKDDRLYAGYCRQCYDRWRAWAAKQADNGFDPSPIAFRAIVRRENAKPIPIKKMMKV